MLRHVDRKIKQAIRIVGGKYYSLARLYYRRQLKRQTQKQRQLILVYQMGKVGSSTVVESLKQAGYSAFNLHTLDPAKIKRGQILYRAEFKKTGALPLTLWCQEYFKQRIEELPVDKKRKIITLVRDPVARNISLFFQWPNMIMVEKGDGYFIRSLSFDYKRFFNKDDFLEELSELFFSKFTAHERPIHWFDKEMATYLDIDVYRHSFPAQKGYRIYRYGDIDLLLIKLEKLGDIAGRAFQEFLGISGFKVIPTNIGRQKKTSGLYKKFLQSIQLPEEYLDRLYNSRFMQHFYSAEEITGFRKKWCEFHP